MSTKANTSIRDSNHVYSPFYVAKPRQSETFFFFKRSLAPSTIWNLKSVQFSKQAQRFYRGECAEFKNAIGFTIGSKNIIETDKTHRASDCSFLVIQRSHGGVSEGAWSGIWNPISTNEKYASVPLFSLKKNLERRTCVTDNPIFHGSKSDLWIPRGTAQIAR